jgi:phenylalanyl-tRNA synthetase beta chain
VPTNRPDLTRAVDLIEEVARLADFDTFPETLPTGPAGGLSAGQARTRELIAALEGFGLHQAVNLPFVAQDELAAFATEVTQVVAVRNPLRDDQSKLRQSLLPGLLRNVRENLNRGAGSVGLFEIGRVFFARPWPEDARVPDQPNRVAVAIAGPFGMAETGTPPALADASTALAALSAIAQRMGLEIERAAARPPGYHPTRTALVHVDGIEAGYAGEIHPDTAVAFEIEGRVAVIELELAPLIAAKRPIEMRAVSTYPHVDFDLSFDVPTGMAGADLVATTRRASDLVEESTVFDDFFHPETGRRSIAIRYRLRAADRTLSRDEIATERDAMVAAAAALGATLRGA